MTAPAEYAVLQRTLDDLRNCVGALRVRYGDVPAVRRLAGDLDRFDLDASELRELPVLESSRSEPVQVLDDRPLDPSLWADADDEGLGGYHRYSR
jgi:hypothetical protein